MIRAKLIYIIRMNTKLTLKLDYQTIREAKQYAKLNQASLSGLVENFFKSITGSQPKKVNRVSPLVASLAGILKKSHVDFKDDYTDYLVKKYK